MNNLIKLINDVLFDNEEECKNCETCKDCDCCNCCCDCCDDENDISLTSLFNGDTLDIKNDKDYKKVKDTIADIRNSISDDTYLDMYKLLLGDNITDILNNLDKLADTLHDDKKEEKKTPVLPSSKLNVQQKEQIHKIVGEYVDTVIKPNTNMDTKVVNDVYAGLFEFACWILNK